MREELITIPLQLELLYMSAMETRSDVTIGDHKKFFTYCCSRDYLEVISNQLALLQIPLSYLLENDYEIERVLSLTE
jgi:hypothetical protein